MSETTNAWSAPTSTLVADEDPGAPARPPVDARDLVHLSQGLYFIFWGLLVAVVVGLQMVLSFWLHSFMEIFLGAGILAVLAGSWRLSQARLAGLQPAHLGQLWRSRARWIFWLAALLTYFCVIFYMWRQAVDQLYLQMNVLAFVISGIVYVIMLSRTVAALAAGLGSNELAMESRLFNVGNIGLLLLPFLAALVYLGTMTIRNESNLLLEFNLLLARISLVMALLFLLPLSLTLAVVWAAKDVAVRRLTEIDRHR